MSHLNEADIDLEDGDPSQDVRVASVVFLVDGKLVLLQPTTDDSGDLKYDMRVIAHNVEYYALMRDQLPDTLGHEGALPTNTPLQDVMDRPHSDQGLADSLWFFNGIDIHVWLDVQDVLKSSTIESARGLNSSIQVSVDFYPLSINISKGILLGLESELVQRRDVNFALFRIALRVSYDPSAVDVQEADSEDTSFSASSPSPPPIQLRFSRSATFGISLQASIIFPTRPRNATSYSLGRGSRQGNLSRKRPITNCPLLPIVLSAIS